LPDYKLYYWSVLFRSQFAFIIIAYAGKSWTESGDAVISTLMKVPVPFMGPPLLVNKKVDFAMAEMPAC
jgi:glutathione S-transferase